MAAIQDLAKSIAQFEGFNTPGTIAARNNNPGNLRWAANQVGQESTVNGKYATFASVEEGWQALYNYIGKNSGMTLRAFIGKYAPPSENDTTGYLNFLVSKLGIGADDTLSQLGVESGGFNMVDLGNSDNLFGYNVDGAEQGGIDPILLGVLAVVVIGGVVWMGGR